MDVILYTGFLPITHSIPFWPEPIKHGKDLVHSGHVTDVKEEFGLNNTKRISALCLSKLAKEKYAKAAKLEDVSSAKRLITSSIKIIEPFDLSVSDVKNLNCPLRNFLEYKNTNKVKLLAKDILKDIINDVVNNSMNEEIIACAEKLFRNSWKSNIYISLDLSKLDPILKQFYHSNVVLCEKEIIKFCLESTNQSSCDEWHSARSIRITASQKAHKVKVCSEKTLDILAEKFVKEDNVPIPVKKRKNKSISALEYGLQHEQEAINCYAKDQPLHMKIIQIGAFVMPGEPWMLVSADAISINTINGDIKVIEVKCPISCRSKVIYDSSANKCNVGYLKIVDGMIELQKKPSIFHAMPNFNVCNRYIFM
ncbi:hypothetical protein TKK_0007793 [Trichogramma kaykai]